MDPVYAGALFLHIALVFLLVGGMAVLEVAETRLAAVTTLEDLRSWAMLAKRTGPVLGPSALVILITGGYMAHAAGAGGAAWVAAAVLGLIFFATSGPLIKGRGIGAAVGMATAAGSVTPAVRARLHTPAMIWVRALRGPFLVWFAYLMAVKPGLPATLIATGVALLAGWAIVRVRRVERE